MSIPRSIRTLPAHLTLLRLIAPTVLRELLRARRGRRRGAAVIRGRDVVDGCGVPRDALERAVLADLRTPDRRARR